MQLASIEWAGPKMRRLPRLTWSSTAIGGNPSLPSPSQVWLKLRPPSSFTCRACASAAVLAGARCVRQQRAGQRGFVVAAATSPEDRLRPEDAAAPDSPVVGFYEVLRPRAPPGVSFLDLELLGSEKGPALGTEIWVRARVATVRVKGKSTFVVLRHNSFYTLQACKFKDKEDGGESATAIAKFFKTLPLESLVDVRGILVEANVSSCTQANVELQMQRAYCVSRSVQPLPFLMADARRSEAEIIGSEGSDRPFVRVLPELRLDNRWLDLRVPANNAILRLKAAVSQLYRESLASRGFVEIHSPKLIAGESEGGAEVFRVDYFGKQASLAQSPQLYKQMAISSDLPGVFEVGPVFRAENSNTNRHLCEFTGLDLEMPIQWNYEEVIQVVHDTLFAVFKGLEASFAKELLVAKQMYPSEAPKLTEKPCILHWPEGMELLAEAAAEGVLEAREDNMADLSTQEEKVLGAMVLKKYDTDLFFLDRYPSSVRPFYTMPCEEQPEYSNSYDVIFRGQEIGSGAQRCHDPELLEARCAELGVDTGPLQSYIESFRHGVPPHGGVGLGLERIVQLYLELDNIRKAVMFTRDPARLSP